MKLIIYSCPSPSSPERTEHEGMITEDAAELICCYCCAFNEIAEMK